MDSKVGASAERHAMGQTRTFRRKSKSRYRLFTKEQSTSTATAIREALSSVKQEALCEYGLTLQPS